MAGTIGGIGTIGILASCVAGAATAKVKYFDKQPTMRNFNRKLQNLNNKIDKRNEEINKLGVKLGSSPNQSRAIPRTTPAILIGNTIETAMNILDERINGVKAELALIKAELALFESGHHPIQNNSFAAAQAAMAAGPPGNGAGQAAELAVIDSNA